jgi:quinol monooxygenase YgiN
MIVRVSRGRFDPGTHNEVAERLSRAQDQLVPAIRRLPGLVSYHAAIDRTSGTLVNISVWERLEHAQAMGTLKEMSDLRAVFESLGVTFEPIVNDENLWSI